MLIASVIVLPVVLALAGFAGYGLVRRALGPIEQMARRAQEITPQRLNERLPNDNADDELGQLARVFNATLARLEQAFEQLRRFTSDASHELRTPLAAIRSVGEVGLQKGGSSAEYRDIIGSMLEEVNRLTSLVDNLLTISRADAGSLQLQMAQIPILQLAREAASLFEVMADEKSLEFRLSGDEAIVVQGDRLFLRQALVNVLHNAVAWARDYEVGGRGARWHDRTRRRQCTRLSVPDSAPARECPIVRFLVETRSGAHVIGHVWKRC
jgi:signal transduction histidine kinase